MRWSASVPFCDQPSVPGLAAAPRGARSEQRRKITMRTHNRRRKFLVDAHGVTGLEIRSFAYLRPMCDHGWLYDGAADDAARYAVDKAALPCSRNTSTISNK
jgi:hypothetical protein